MIAAVHTSSVVLVVAVFLASAVEMVEALTIVLAVSVTRGRRAALAGALAAVALLGALVAAVGPALVHVPLSTLRMVIGGLLLVFGLQWLRKAILRAAGLKAKHDEDAIFAEQVAELSGTGDRGAGSAAGTGGSRGSRWLGRIDRAGAVVSFKGVFLEGLEVVVVVLTLGSTSHDVPLAALAAGAAVIVVGAIGALVARQLSGVPENAMKMAVGLMLVSFGTFWSGEGIHVRWPGSDLAIVALVAFYGLSAWAVVRLLAGRRSAGRRSAGRQPVPEVEHA